MRVQLTPRAAADLEDVYLYLTKRSPSGAHNVLVAIYVATRYIADQPLGSEQTDSPSVRVKLVGHYPYKIFYRVRANVAEILHIRHTARRPWAGE